MTTGKVGPSSATLVDLHPYRNSSSKGSRSATTTTNLPYEEPLTEIPPEDANNVVGNETVVIYQFDSGATNTNTMHGSPVDLERERIRMEFYATYDAMTGVRIAATLAGFFGLMVMLIMYKSRTNMLRALKDPNLAAVAAEMVQEEEERELQEVFDTLEAAGIYPELDSLPYRERRLLSLGNISAPPMLSYSPRFSSVGGGSCSLWDPPTRPPGPHHRPSVFSTSSPSGVGRREMFRNSLNNSSSDRSQCVSFDMSESTVRQPMGRRRSEARAWMGRRATFQSIHTDALRSRNKVFLSNSRQGRESNRIKLIRLYTTSSEDVEEVIEHGLLSEEEGALETVVSSPPPAHPQKSATNLNRRQQSTSSTSFIVSSVDYQDSDLRSIGSMSMFSDRPGADTDEEGSSDDDSVGNRRQVARLRSGAYQKLQQKRTTNGQINDCSVTTFEAPQTTAKVHSPPRTRPKSLHETRTVELHSAVPKSFSSTGGVFGQTSRDMVHQLLRREEQQRKLTLGLFPGTKTEWSKETLF